MSNLDRSHLNTLETHLSHERSRLANAKTVEEKAMRCVWVVQLEKEIAGEKNLLGVESEAESTENLTNDQLLSQLFTN